MKAADLAHSDKPLNICVGFSQIGAESAWRSAETTSINEEAALRKVTLISNDAQQKQENQIKAIRSFIAQKVDAIILAPVVEAGWDNVLKEAKKANIPVILVDRGVKVSDDSLYTTLIASDFVEEGRMAAEKLVAAVDKNIPKSVSRTRNIAQIEGTTGAAPANDRASGFKEVIEKNPNFKIVKSQCGEFTRAKGKEVMEAFLKSGEKFDAVYAHNDDMALGAIQAIKEAGLKPGKDIVVVSIDGVKGAFQALIDGSLAACVECNPLLGPLAFDAIAAAKDGKKLAKQVIVDDKAFDAESAKKELKNRKY
jgi:simple sugar transport system substrate-binding protein